MQNLVGHKLQFFFLDRLQPANLEFPCVTHIGHNVAPQAIQHSNNLHSSLLPTFHM